MIEFLEYIDTRLFIFFNGNHTPFMDSVMDAVTNKYTWIPFYLIILFFVWKKVKSKMWLVVLSVVILITLSDQISVHLFKEIFQRYRPCHNLLLQDRVQLINGHCGGDYGFVSSHAANAFALTTFLIFFFRRRDFALFMYLWASVVCYSRVYAGVHYPFDILGGMMLGIFLGLIGYKIYFHLDKSYAE
ncbi:MAG: phosphatase PAP2 family protein [Bacteroidetes bacterium]|nr:MAG: phosphatase PAP2 family protein [Bacteroidota bacterium]